MPNRLYDMRENNVAIKDTPQPVAKKTNSAFKLSDLPTDDEMLDDEERQELVKEQQDQLQAQQEEDAKYNNVQAVSDKEDELADMVLADDEKYKTSEIKRNAESLLRDYEYTDVPKIPEEYRGANIIGLRTRPTGTTSLSIGVIAPKKKLRLIWDNLTPVEKYILMLISEHRHLTTDQLETLIVLPTRIKGYGAAGYDSLKPYFRWVTQAKYGEELAYKDTFKTSTTSGLQQKLDHLADLNLIEEVQPSYHVYKNDNAEYNRMPSLFTSHYYLTVEGARVLICNTLATKPSAKLSENKHSVGFVPTYRSSAYMSVVHETETTDTFISIIRNALYISNIDAMGLRPANDTKDYGYIDICRFYHEKDCEEKYVKYHDDEAMIDRTIDFKTDGKLVLYSSLLDDFVDYYLEYDSGSSTASKITHKTEAFIRYIMWEHDKYGDRFRNPVLLLVTQNPAAYMPGLRDDKPTRYTRGIQKVAELFPEKTEELNKMATILECDCRAIRMHGGMGACWHVLDLGTGVPERKGKDILAASVNALNGR